MDHPTLLSLSDFYDAFIVTGNEITNNGSECVQPKRAKYPENIFQILPTEFTGKISTMPQNGLKMITVNVIRC